MLISSFEHGGSNDPDFVLIILHGYGSNSSDVIGLGSFFEDKVGQKKIAYYAPNAPFDCVTGNNMFEIRKKWFDLHGVNNEQMISGLNSASEAVQSFIEKQVFGDHQLDWNKVIIVGFSQGAMIALDMIANSVIPLKKIISFAGTLLDYSAREPIEENRVACILHGIDDDIISFRASELACDVLSKIGIDCFFDTISNCGHCIDERAMQIACKFLSETITKNNTEAQV